SLRCFGNAKTLSGRSLCAVSLPCCVWGAHVACIGKFLLFLGRYECRCLLLAPKAKSTNLRSQLCCNVPGRVTHLLHWSVRSTEEHTLGYSARQKLRER